MPLHIVRFDGKYRFLSNFYPYTPREGLSFGMEALEIEFEGLVYPSTEHAYQAAKTDNTEDRERIRDCSGAGESKKLGRKVMLRKDWEEIQDVVMAQVLREKFGDKDPDLEAMLLDTGDAYLVEGNHWHDRNWGVCYCSTCLGIGKNKLGLLLMTVRSERKSINECR